MTPVMAFAPQTADAGPRNHLDLFHFARRQRNEIPHHESEEVLVNRSSIEQDEHRIRQGAVAARLVTFRSRADVCAVFIPGTLRSRSTISWLGAFLRKVSLRTVIVAGAFSAPLRVATH